MKDQTLTQKQKTSFLKNLKDENLYIGRESDVFLVVQTSKNTQIINSEIFEILNTLGCKFFVTFNFELNTKIQLFIYKYSIL